jgi:predicted O-methyltransferase YrrM
MRTIEQLKEAFINLKIKPTGWLGDSPTRFETYQSYASSVDRIVELGVYTGLSTTAFLMGKPKKLRSYDILPENFIVKKDLMAYAEDNSIDFKFIVGNSLEIDIDETDLLFIDTVHKKEHTVAELHRHANKTQKYIMLHDVESCPDVFDAAIEFIEHNPEWIINEHCKNGDGLLVLRKQ